MKVNIFSECRITKNVETGSNPTHAINDTHKIHNVKICYIHMSISYWRVCCKLFQTFLCQHTINVIVAIRYRNGREMF